MKVGLQLYTLRDDMAKDFLGTLKEVARLGYQGVEFAGYGGLSAEQLKQELQALNLLAAGSHVSYERVLSALDEEIAFNLTIGNRYLIVPYLEDKYRESDAAWKQVFAELSRMGKRCAEKGLVLCYHNHEFELLEHVEGEIALDAMFAQVGQEELQVELDTCWVNHAGFDAVSYIQKYQGRLPLIHFKDMVSKGEGRPDTVELGQGEMDLPAVAKAADAAGVEWLIVEQDHCQNPPLTSVANSMNWIKEYAKQGGPVHV
jgi:sugar phosphate isomerase/epimerase